MRERRQSERTLPGIQLDASRAEVDAYVALSLWRAAPRVYRAAQKLAADGRLPDLVAARKRYQAEVIDPQNPAREHRIRPHSWFGREQRWLEYHGTPLVPEKKPSPGAAKGDEKFYQQIPRW